ncbi:MAG: hypothetical protein FJ398_10370 [Verrucomicrobia bacterium]|nr:hypothetical protein [Verrucomicrobiota bacterium]
MRTKAEVLLAFLEYRAFYGEPLFQVWGQPGILVHALYRAFREWDVKLDSVYGDHSSCVVDLSASYVDTLFLRMTRTFGGCVRLEELAQELAEDQTRVLEILELETD